MSDTVRTTITLPSDLLEKLRLAAFNRKTNLSTIIREGVSHVVGYNPVKKGKGIFRLKGKYTVKGMRGVFNRKTYYESDIFQDMSS